VQRFDLAAMASRRRHAGHGRVLVVAGAHGRVTASSSAGSQSKSGKPWPRLTAWCSAARADMTVKMVVPTLGRRLGKAGGAVLFRVRSR
jgi:hypothetical protein